MRACPHFTEMQEYAKDAAMREDPWVLWEASFCGRWHCMTKHPTWAADQTYRRKRTPLCQIEGRDVFSGDTLYYYGYKDPCTALAKVCVDTVLVRHVGKEWPAPVTMLTWTAPAQLKTVHQWAWHDAGQQWCISSVLCETEREWREKTGHFNCQAVKVATFKVPV